MATETTPRDRLKRTLANLANREKTTDAHIRAALLEAYLDGVDAQTLYSMGDIAWPKRTG